MCNYFHFCKRHLKKRTGALDPLPPAYAVYAIENDDNYGRPLTGPGKTLCILTWVCWEVDTQTPMTEWNGIRRNQQQCLEHCLNTEQLLVLVKWTVLFLLYNAWSTKNIYVALLLGVVHLLLKLSETFSTRPSDREQIWHACADRDETGSHLNKIYPPHPTPPQEGLGGYLLFIQTYLTRVNRALTIRVPIFYFLIH